jgi:hypothetical protein
MYQDVSRQMSWFVLPFRLGKLILFLGWKWARRKCAVASPWSRLRIKQVLKENGDLRHVLKNTNPSPYKIRRGVDLCGAEGSMVTT